MGLSLFDESVPFIGGYDFTDSDSTTAQGLNTGERSMLRVDSILCVNTQATPVVVRFSLYDGSNNFALGSIEVPASAGLAGAAAYEAMPDLITSPIAGIVLPPFWQLRAWMATALPSGEECSVVVQGGAV